MNTVQKTLIIGLILILVLILIRCGANYVRVRVAEDPPYVTLEPERVREPYEQGLCTFAKSCPVGWSDMGPAGVLQHGGEQGSKLNWVKGGNGNPLDTSFQIPRYCCKDGTPSDGTAPSVLSPVNNPNCANGQTSHILVRPEDATRTGLTTIGYHYGWAWQKFDTCPNPDEVQEGDYMLSYPCPTGWQDMGMGGMLVPPENAGEIPGAGGSNYAGWQWRHPKICKKVTQ